MKKTFGAFLALLGILMILAGVGWRVFVLDNDRIHAKLVAGNAAGVLEEINQLKAKPMFQAARFLPGVMEDLLLQEGWALYKLGDREGAAKKFREVIDYHDKSVGASALFNAATLDLSPEKFERTIRDYEEVLKKKPDHLRAQRNLEILRQIEQEERRRAGEGEPGTENSNSPSSGRDASGEQVGKGKKGSRTKDKFEYRDGNEPSSDSPNIRF